MKNNALILIIDDEPQIRKFLKICLETNDYRVIEAEAGKEGMQMAMNHLPDLILLDLGLPDKSGHDVLCELRLWYNKPIIILSVINNEGDIVKALDNTATDYLIKPFRTGELLARMRSALRKSDQQDTIDQVITSGDLEIDLLSRELRKGGLPVKLTVKEFNLMALFFKYEGRVLTHQFILKEIWGVPFQTETQYLRVFISSLRKKIEDDYSAPKHLLTESGVGYRFR